METTRDFSYINKIFFLRYLKTPAPYILLIPFLGIVLFIGFYIVAAFTYPGGSAAYPGHVGFSFWDNYLCDLLDEYALNGEINGGRFYARLALTILSTSLLVLWFYLPKLFDKITLNIHIMWISGLVSLLIVFFLAAKTHDEIIRFAGAFGVLAFILSSYELYKAGYYKICLLAIASLFIFLANYYIYETGIYIASLPSVQKVTFVICLSWFLSLNLRLFKKLKLTSKQASL